MSRPPGWARSLQDATWHLLAPESDPPLDVPVARCGKELRLIAVIADHPSGHKCVSCELYSIADSSAGLGRQDE